MTPTLQKPSWADLDWETRCEKAMNFLNLLVEPVLLDECGNTLDKYFRVKKHDRLFKDLALILIGNDFPSNVNKVRELVLVFSEKCECKECVFHSMEAV